MINAYGYDEEKASQELDKYKSNIGKWFKLVPPYENIEYDYNINIDQYKPYAKLQGVQYLYFEGLIEYGVIVRCIDGKYKRIQVKPEQLEVLERDNWFIGEGI